MKLTKAMMAVRRWIADRWPDAPCWLVGHRHMFTWHRAYDGSVEVIGLEPDCARCGHTAASLREGE